MGHTYMYDRCITTVTMQVPGVWPWSLCSYRTILEVRRSVWYIPGKQRNGQLSGPVSGCL